MSLIIRFRSIRNDTRGLPTITFLIHKCLYTTHKIHPTLAVAQSPDSPFPKDLYVFLPRKELAASRSKYKPHCIPYLLSALPLSSILNQGTLVLNCTPCHPLISSPNTLLTSLCCFNIFNPLNFSLTTSIPYILPHPPLISCTCSFVGLSSLFNKFHIFFSASSRCSGASSISAARAASSATPSAPAPTVPLIVDGDSLL